MFFGTKGESCKVNCCVEVVFVGNGGGEGTIVSSRCGGGCLTVIYFFGQAEVHLEACVVSVSEIFCTLLSARLGEDFSRSGPSLYGSSRCQ